MRPLCWTAGVLSLLGSLACNSVPTVEQAQAKMREAAHHSSDRSHALSARQPLTLEPIEIAPVEHPLARLDQAALVQLVKQAPDKLGSVSIGRANRGALFNGVQMPESHLWELVDPDRSWAAEETVRELASAITAVAAEYPDCPRLFIGDMSKRRGGYFRPHRSHQSGADADVGYYYLDGPGWYKKANAENLDRRLTWALIKALLTQGKVEYLFIDRSVQALLKEHALQVEPDHAWVEQLFGHPGGRAPGTIRHARGHQTHMHVRFYNDEARETARRTYKLLAAYRKL